MNGLHSHTLIMALLTFSSPNVLHRNTIHLSGCQIMVELFVNAIEFISGTGWIREIDFSCAVTVNTPAHAEFSKLFYFIHFSNIPVPGTLKRGALFPFDIPMDSVAGDTTNYVASKQVKNPLTGLDEPTMVEAQRLYLVNCGICHGTKLDGNGPLYRGGDGPFPAKPATLVGDVKYESMPEGQMYYSVTYGKNKMGSYASQLDTRQRWMVIAYIKSKQAGSKVVAAAASDSTGNKK